MNLQILIIDDEQDIRTSLCGILEDEGYRTLQAENGEKGLEVLGNEQVDLVLLDIWMPGMDGLETLEQIHSRYPQLPVIMISGHGTIETAVSAIKKGATDFIEKPLSLDKVLLSSARALELSSLRRENQVLRSRFEGKTENVITGQSEVMAELKEQIARVAPTDAWVLITGENGTGKEVVAQSLHSQSKRSDKPLVAVNCAAIPEELIESELFGHEKGAFTGADSAKIGKFELANQGTLFLDEIGDMSLKTQAKILRILQEQSFERVGGNKTIKVDVRVVAATNKDLEAAIANNTFRQDLYYRLRVFPITLPALRQRKGDLPMLIDEFMYQLSREHGFNPLSFSKDALQVLESYSWPGNVRELRNFVERMLILYPGQTVSAKKLPAEYLAHAPQQVNETSNLADNQAGTPQGQLGTGVPAAGDTAENSGDSSAGSGSLYDNENEPFEDDSEPDDFKAARNAFEARFLARKLKEYNGNVAKLAEAIGLERSYLYRKMRSHNIQTD